MEINQQSSNAVTVAQIKPIAIGVGVFMLAFLLIDAVLFALGLGGIFYKKTGGLTPQQFFENELASAWEQIQQGWRQITQGAQQIWNSIVDVLRGGE